MVDHSACCVSIFTGLVWDYHIQDYVCFLTPRYPDASMSQESGEKEFWRVNRICSSLATKLHYADAAWDKYYGQDKNPDYHPYQGAQGRVMESKWEVAYENARCYRVKLGDLYFSAAPVVKRSACEAAVPKASCVKLTGPKPAAPKRAGTKPSGPKPADPKAKRTKPAEGTKPAKGTRAAGTKPCKGAKPSKGTSKAASTKAGPKSAPCKTHKGKTSTTTPKAGLKPAQMSRKTAKVCEQPVQGSHSMVTRSKRGCV
eukprot:jgi/Chrzof1/13137/Cz07g21090.t1